MTPEINSPAYIAAVNASGPSRQNPQGSQLYQQAMGQAFDWQSQLTGLVSGSPGGNQYPDPSQLTPQALSQIPNIRQVGLGSPGVGITSITQLGGGGGTNLGVYGTGDQGGPGTPSGTTTPTPSPLNYLGLPNYANLGSNFTGGTNSDNPFAGLFGGPDQTNFLSNWT